MVMRRAEAGPDRVAMTGGMAPPRLAPRMRTMMRPADSVPVAASDRISTTTARLEEETKASTAEKISATGHAPSSRPMKTPRAGEARIGSVAPLSRCRERSIRPMPIKAVPPPCLALNCPFKNNARKDQKRRQPFHAGGHDPGGDGGADIGAKQHHLRHTRFDEVTLGEGGDGQCRRRRAFAMRRWQKAGKERTRAVLGAGRQHASQFHAEGAGDPVLHLGKAEEQQRDCAEKVDDDNGGLHATSPHTRRRTVPARVILLSG